MANTDPDVSDTFHQLWSDYEALASLVSKTSLLLHGPDGLYLGIPDGEMTTEALRCKRSLTEDDEARVLVITQQLGLTWEQASAL